MKIRSIRLAAVLATVGLLAAACGGDDDAGDDGATETTVTTETTATGDTEAPSVTAGESGTGTSTPATTDDTTTDGEPCFGDVDTEGIDRDATLRIGIFSPMTTADPHAVGATVSTPYFNMMYDRLLWVDRDSRVCPYLATAWEFEGDALVLTLREDATFHDGTPVDAAAVKANLERAKTIETSAYKRQLEPVQSIDAVDSHTVRLNLLPNRGATLPYVLGGWAGMIMNPKFLDPETLKTSAPDGVGSGPYKLVSWTPGEPEAVFERAEGHWDKGAGQAARVEMYFSSDQLQQINAVSAGQDSLALVSNLAAVEAQNQAKSSDSVHIGEPQTAYTNAAIWMRDLVDPTVRQAIAYAVDRDSLNAIYQGGAETVNQVYPEGHPMHIDEIDGIQTYDPDKARELVASAPKGSTSLTIAYVEGSGNPQIVELLQAQLADVGIDVTLEPMTYQSMYQGWFTNQFEVLNSGTAGPAHVSLAIDQMLLRAGTNWGAPDAAVPEIEAQLNQADDPKLTDDQRNEIYRGILLRAAEESWMVVWAHFLMVPIAQADVVNLQLPFTYQAIPDYRYVAKKAD